MSYYLIISEALASYLLSSSAFSIAKGILNCLQFGAQSSYSGTPLYA